MKKIAADRNYKMATAASHLDVAVTNLENIIDQIVTITAASTIEDYKKVIVEIQASANFALNYESEPSAGAGRTIPSWD